MKNNKLTYRIISILSIVFALLSLSSLGFVAYKMENQKKEISLLLKNERLNLKIYKEFISYPLETFETQFSSGKKGFVYIGNAECPDCSSFYPVLLKVIRKYNLSDKIAYVEGKYLREESNNWMNFKKKYNFSQTPALIIYGKGEIISEIEWDQKEGITENRLEKWIDDNLDNISSI